MKHIIQFQVTKGEEQYVASGVGIPVVTQGKTFDELIRNIGEALSLHLEGEDLSRYDVVPKPSVLINFELPSLMYA